MTCSRGVEAILAKRISAAEAKAQFSALVAGVAFRGEQYVIERQGKPLAALVSVHGLEKLQDESSALDRRRGALALVGMWGNVEDTDIDTFIADVYFEREQGTGRTVDLQP